MTCFIDVMKVPFGELNSNTLLMKMCLQGSIILKGSRQAICKYMYLDIDKISSLSCQKVADSNTSSKMCNNVAKQTSARLRNIPEYICCHPSAYFAVTICDK